MALFDLVVLALVQGITEFLPISSSGHLALWPLLTGRPDQGVVMDISVHLGTLVAVCLYFRRDLARLAVGAAHILTGRFGTTEARLAWLIALATVPAVIAGAALKLSGQMEGLRSIAVIGWATVLGGVALWAADRWGGQGRDGSRWGLRDAVLMGLAQACALVPGVSRSGACMTMARALGYERTEAARLALLMAVPVILAAGLAAGAEVAGSGDVALGRDFALGAALSCLAALGALSVMMRMFRASWTMTPFVLYRLALGAGLLALAYG